MKKLATMLGLSLIASAAFGQGTVNFGNLTATAIRTNATAVGGTIGNTSPALGGFHYALFTASSTVTTIGSSLDLLTPTWTFTGTTATNTAVAAGGRLNGGLGVATQTGWQPGATNSFVVVGWSSSLGANWAEVANALVGATWEGNRYNLTGGAAGYLGVSSRGFGFAGGGPQSLPAFGLFGSPSAQGTPIGTGFDLYTAGPVPEPSSMALAALGAASLLIFRRRK